MLLSVPYGELDEFIKTLLLAEAVEAFKAIDDICRLLPSNNRLGTPLKLRLLHLLWVILFFCIYLFYIY